MVPERHIDGGVEARDAGRDRRPLPQLLVVEDDERTARAFASVVAADAARVDVALTVEEALARIARPPRLGAILLDLLLPDGAGEWVLDAIESGSAPPRVLVITGIEDPPRLVAVMLRGYHILPKPMSAPALREAARWLVALADPVSMFAADHGLPPRETEVLRLGVEGLTGKQIAAKLGLAENTVWVYWHRIAAKCGCDSQRAVIAKVFRFAARSPSPSPQRNEPDPSGGKGSL